MAFFAEIRCIVMLMLPQLLSSRGRAFLMAYALILVMHGPMMNFTHNLQVLADSTTCGQELAANSTSQLEELALSPVYRVISAVKEAICGLIRFINEIKRAFLALKATFDEIFAAIKRVTSWLNNLVNICNENMGGPYKRCKKGFEMANENCKRIMGSMKFLCHVAYIFRHVCHLARVAELFCSITDAIKSTIVNNVKTKVMSTIKDVNALFYVNITLTYKYNYTEMQSQSYAEVRAKIMDRIRSQLEVIDDVGSLFGIVASLMLLWIVVKAIIYRHKYCTNDRFDNRYLSFYLRDIDERRSEIGHSTIFPLSGKLTKKYASSLSPFLVGPEKVKLITGVVFLAGMLLHTVFYLACDYGLYWLLYLIKKHAEVKIYQDRPARTAIHVQGDGALASMYRHLIQQFDPFSHVKMDLDTTGCLPHPHLPDYDSYATIFTIYGVCLFMVVMEAYGLRLRHVIASCYYPDRERTRACWLYNHLYVKQHSLNKFLKRQLHRKRMCDARIEKISFRSRMAAQFTICRKILAFYGYERKYCTSCSQPGMPYDKETFKHCNNDGCTSVYCLVCFGDLNNQCVSCLNPIDYSVINDNPLSEEYDSSDEEEAALQQRVRVTSLPKSVRVRSDTSSATDPESDGTVEAESGSDDQLYNWRPTLGERIYCSARNKVTTDIFDGETDVSSDDSDGARHFLREPQTVPLIRN
ncbi:DC-STAMP domain-containing protein 2-like [Tubulanus polymorphus]|uniref:DC-STAMP domain-containing protein 2-like n=1 Tax=Tubulanus polymorphus TaxID=672921 RepID=UPI003DA5D7D8